MHDLSSENSQSAGEPWLQILIACGYSTWEKSLKSFSHFLCLPSPILRLSHLIISVWQSFLVHSERCQGTGLCSAVQGTDYWTVGKFYTDWFNPLLSHCHCLPSTTCLCKWPENMHVVCIICAKGLGNALSVVCFSANREKTHSKGEPSTWEGKQIYLFQGIFIPQYESLSRCLLTQSFNPHGVMSDSHSGCEPNWILEQLAAQQSPIILCSSKGIFSL